MTQLRINPASLTVVMLAAACGTSGQPASPIDVESSAFETCVAGGGTVEEQWSTENFRGAVTSLAVSGSTVVLASIDGSVKQWRTGGDPSYGTTFSDEGVAIRALAVSRDGLVLGGDMAGRLSEWQLSDASPMRTTTIGEAAVTALAVDDAWVAVQSGEDPDVRIVDRATATVSAPLETTLWGVSALAFGHGDLFVTAGHNYGAPSIERRLAGDPATVVETWADLSTNGGISAVAIDEAATTLVAASPGFVAVFDPQEIAAGPLAFTSAPDHAPVGITLLPGNQLFATAGGEGALKIWRVATGELVTTLAVPTPVGIGVDAATGRLFTSGDDGVLHAIDCQ